MSPLLLLLPLLLATLLSLPVPLLHKTHPITVVPDLTLCNVPDSIQFDIYQSSVNILGIYIPAAITVLLIIFGPGGLPAPCVLACAMRSLAIVITNFRSLFLSFSLFSPSFAFDPLRGISRVQKFVSPNILA